MKQLLPCVLDHLVVGAASLEEGSDYVADLLGEVPTAGGRHQLMGTCNRLLRLGESAYLEVIAIDPHGCRPATPRWFSLDSATTRAALDQGPRLLAWVVRTRVIEQLAALPAYAGCEVRPMARGALRWRFGFTADGGLPGDGVLPHVIQWDVDGHPLEQLPAGRCTLVALEGRTARPAPVIAALEQMGLGNALSCQTAQAGQAALTAHLVTPRGAAVLN
ncbi:MAG: VOC family protein [Arenicellales bacterium]|nr:VOC family protein [Arenicellales bacterium]MDP6854395.1 VOC family protein [Arenicellales bacterium]MDP6947661.1 VOC family protein [Arenicellales bacterium]